VKRFFSVIIGSELLNGRRSDKHFAFLTHALKKRGWTQEGSFVIKDDPVFMRQLFSFLRDQKDAVVFFFGGIGATPDDCTREVAACVFREGELEPNLEAQALIHTQFGTEATSHRLRMGELPKNAELLHNVINQIPGFSLDQRFFFMPGFPSMAWPMAEEALERYVGNNPESRFTCSFIAYTGESNMISLMHALPSSLELSSLPRLKQDGTKEVEIYLASTNKDVLKEGVNIFISGLAEQNISHTMPQFTP
jgi:molybdopterin-biosynthesis enzyme MoeA-like protein